MSPNPDPQEVEVVARAMYVRDEKSGRDWDREQRPGSWKDGYRRDAARSVAALNEYRAAKLNETVGQALEEVESSNERLRAAALDSYRASKEWQQYDECSICGAAPGHPCHRVGGVREIDRPCPHRPLRPSLTEKEEATDG